MGDNIASDITPSRKRKRNYEKYENQKNVCFTNSAFSSTPKKITGRRRLLAVPKENINPSNSCMEVKSIAELVEEKKKTAAAPTINPYEVQRKPPKKKKRELLIEEACFENPALNLNGPERQFNPFEVVRDINKNEEDQRKCFVNPALNIKGQDTPPILRNPFEIERNESNPDPGHKPSTTGYENLGLDEMPPSSLKIGLPFTPTVGCRIDFNNIPLSQLTPSKLLLSEKLVFSPVPAIPALPKRSLDAISEESSSVSIGKELDRYQLELENSINEAKMRKDIKTGETGVIEKECVYQLQLKVEKRTSLGVKLSDIAETEEYEIETTEELKTVEEIEFKSKCPSPNLVESKMTEPITATVIEQVKDSNPESNCNAGFDYDSEEEDNFDFKAPAPFVRAYRRDNIPKSASRESVNSNNSAKSSENVETHKKHNSVKDLIRKSIRKIASINHHHEKIADEKPVPELPKTKENEEKHCTLSSHIMTSLRQSLRRKPKIKEEAQSTEQTSIPMSEISIIDTSERRIKLKSSLPQNEYARIEDLTNERKGSLRRSTREMRHQIMKTLFQHKEEEYIFKK